MKDLKINKKPFSETKHYSGKYTCDCSQWEDEYQEEVYEFTGQILGESIANFVLFSSPEVIVLFGGVTKAGDLLLNSIRKHMEANLLPIFQNKIKIMLSQLNESDAAILGASALIIWSTQFYYQTFFSNSLL